MCRLKPLPCKQLSTFIAIKENNPRVSITERLGDDSFDVVISMTGEPLGQMKL